MKKKFGVSNVEMGVIKAIFREKGELIGRPGLSNVNHSEIQVISTLSKIQPKGVFVCRVQRDMACMTYRIDTRAGKQTVGIYDPQDVCVGSGCRVKNGPQHAGEQR